MEAIRAPKSPTSPHAMSPPGGRGPGLAERVVSMDSGAASDWPPHRLSTQEVENIDKDCVERFLKVNVKHITDGMVI